MGRLTGRDVDAMFGDFKVFFKNITLTIEDSSTKAVSNGVPNGVLGGSYAAAGEVELDTANLGLFIEAARKAGSFSQLEPFDVVFNAESVAGGIGEDSLKVEAFGCLIRVSDLINADGAGGDQLMHKLSYDVTHPDFVKINGVNYIADELTKDLR